MATRIGTLVPPFTETTRDNPRPVEVIPSNQPFSLDQSWASQHNNVTAGSIPEKLSPFDENGCWSINLAIYWLLTVVSCCHHQVFLSQPTTLWISGRCEGKRPRSWKKWWTEATDYSKWRFPHDDDDRRPTPLALLRPCRFKIQFEFKFNYRISNLLP